MSARKPFGGDDQDRPRRADAKTKKAGEGKSEEREKKDRITLYFRRSLLEEARSVVVQAGYAGEGPRSLSELFDQALEAELKKLRKRLNRGEAFQPYKAPLPGGRPKGGTS